MPYTLQLTDRFKANLRNLPHDVKNPAKKAVYLLAKNPRHASLQTHKISGAMGDYGGEVFEAYVTMKYRMTWEYGPDRGTITLRNIDNHDDCLKNP